MTTNPQSIGKVTTTAGVPVCIMANLSTDTGLKVHKIVLESLYDNSGRVYIGSATMNTTTLEGVLHIVATASAVKELTTNVGMNVLDPWQIYIDVSSDNEGVTGYIQVV